MDRIKEIDMNKITPEGYGEIYGGTNPYEYAPGQLDADLRRLRTQRPAGMPQPNPDISGQIQQLTQFIAAAPRMRNPQQEMTYQTAIGDLTNLQKIYQQQQIHDQSLEERKYKMQLEKEAREEQLKLKREAHFEKLRRMGNAAKMADYASGKTQAGTFTGAGGTVSVPTVDAKAMPTLGNITNLIGQGKSVEARAQIENRRSGILNFLMKNPVTDEATGAAKAELAQLGNLYSEIAATEKQKLINQGGVDKVAAKPVKPQQTLMDVQNKKTIEALAKYTPVKIDEMARKEYDKNFTATIPGVRGTFGTTKAMKKPLKDMTWAEALQFFAPQIEEAALANGYEWDKNNNYFYKNGKPLEAGMIENYFVNKSKEAITKEVEAARQQVYGGQTATANNETELSDEQLVDFADQLVTEAENLIKQGSSVDEIVKTINDQREELKRNGATDHLIDWVIGEITGGNPEPAAGQGAGATQAQPTADPYAQYDNSTIQALVNKYRQAGQVSKAQRLEQILKARGIK